MYPIGATVDIALMLDSQSFISQESVQVFSLSQSQLFPPTSIQIDNEVNVIRIIYDQATPSLSGDIVVCLLTNAAPDVRRRKRIATDPRQCGRIISIDVTSMLKLLATYL